MNDVLKIGKKALTYTVVATTILWSVGAAALVAPLVASAQTTVALSDGDVVKGTSTKDVFVFSGGNRYTFPTSNVFLSWNKDFSGVKTVSDAQLGGIAIAGTVAYRPGTYLIKVATDPKVYAVEPGGVRRWVETEAIAVALFGSQWNKRIHDVSPAIFPYVYPAGASLSSATAPVGSLVRVGTDVWHVDAGNVKHKVSAAGLTANRWDNKFVLTGVNIAALTEGPMIEGAVAKHTNASQMAMVVVAPVTPGVPLVVPAGPKGTGVTVALASDTPAGATVVTDTNATSNGAQAQIPVLRLNFSASADGDVKVTSVKLKRGGISADTDISNMYLFDGETRLASNPTIATTMVSWTNTSGLFTVAKGTTKAVDVKLDLRNLTSTGKTYTFSVAAAADVTTDGAAVNGTFPVTGNAFTLAGVTDLGKLTITSVSPSAASTVDPGNTGHEIWRMQVAVLNQDVEIRKLRFTVVGSVSTGDLKNIALWDGATQIGTTVAELASDKTVLIQPATPYVLKTGVTKNISLKADIVGGTNRAFRASLQDSSDVVVYDRGYNVFLKHAGSDTFSVIQPNASGTAVDWTINVGRLTMSVAADSPTGNVASSTTNVTMAKFKFEAVGEDVKVTSLDVRCDGDSDTETLANVKLLLDGVQVGTTDSTTLCNAFTEANSQSFGNSFIVKGGKSAVLSVVADTTNSTVSANDTLQVRLVAGSSNAQGVISLASISTTVQTGRILTVRGNTASVARNASFGDKSSTTPTGTVNASNIRVASMVITAGSGEAIDVTQIALTETASTCIGTSLQNVRLVNSAGTQIAPTLSAPSTTCATANSFTFNVSPTVVIPAGSDYVVDIFADTKSTALSAVRLISFDSVTASGRDTGTSANYGTDLTLQNIEIASSGSLTAAADADTPVANNMLMGATGQTLAKFKLTAGASENVTVTQLVLLNKVSSAATGTVSNIKLIDDSTGLQIGTTLPSFGTTNATTTFTYGTFANLSLNVPKSGIKVVKVVGDLVSYEQGGYSTTGQTVALSLAPQYGGASTNSFTVQGAQSGVTLTTTITASSETGNVGTALAPVMTLYRAKLSTAYAGDTPSGASSPNAAQTVLKFIVTNLANAGSYPATVEAVDFDLSTTISNTTGNKALVVYKDSLSTTALVTTNFNANEIQNFADAGITRAAMTDVEISSGASKTFFVTLNTSAAATTKSLSIRIGNTDVAWTDGVSTNITLMGNELPLTFKTFTY